MINGNNQQVNNTNGISTNGNKKKRKNTAINQCTYRERQKLNGLSQINVFIPTYLHKELYQLLKKDKETLEKIIELINDKFNKKDKEVTNFSNVTTSDEVAISIDIRNELDTNQNNIEYLKTNVTTAELKASLFNNEYYVGNFSIKVKLATKHYKVVSSSQVEATKEEIEQATNYLEKIGKILTEHKELGADAQVTILHKKGYFTLSEDNQRTAPSRNVVLAMRRYYFGKS